MLVAVPSGAFAKAEDAIGAYANARLAEIDNRDAVAVKTYLKLYRGSPESEILADRMFASAIRSGDMDVAVRAARMMELRNGGSSETALLLFADAFQTKNWAMAEVAADALALNTNFGFMTPILKSWVRVAQGKPAELPEADADQNPFYAYYSTDQRIYLHLASSEISAAKYGLRAIATQPDDYVRDLLITSARVIAGSGDTLFADALMRSALRSGGPPPAVKPLSKIPAQIGLSAFYRRISAALVEQNVLEQGLLLARIAAWIAPSDEPSLIVVAKALDANGLTEAALSALAEIDPPSPYGIVAIETRTGMLAGAGRHADAVTIALQANDNMPGSIPLKLLLGRAHEANGNLPDALKIYRQLLSSDEMSKWPPRQQGSYRLLLASTLDRSGDWQSAQVELEKILVIDPNNPQVLNYLGYTLLEKGADRLRATSLVQRAYDLNPESSAITDSLGWAYYLDGKIAQALPLLEKAAKAAVDDAAINEHLGDAYWALGRRRAARYAWNIARQSAAGDVEARLASKIDLGLPRQ